MIVFHLITSIDKGGAESHLYSLIKKQIEKKISVHVIYLRGNNYWRKHLTKIGVKVYKIYVKNNFDFLSLFKAFLKLQSLIVKIQPSVVHAHLSTMELLGALLNLKLKNKFKFIVTKHLDSFFLEASFGRKNFIRGIFIDRFIINQSSRVICISKQVKKFFSKKIPLYNKYKLIYYGFSSKDFKNSKNINNKIKLLKKKFKLKNDEIILLNVARHVKQKSLDTLLKAFAIYEKKQKKAKLILVGNGRETEKLKSLSIELGISNKLSWIKSYENIKDIFLLSDVFVLSSEYEGLGLVLLEAMSSNVPIIATNTSAIPEVIINNYNGMLFEKGNFRVLANKFHLIEKKNIKDNFKKNSIKILNKRFNLDKMNNLTTNIYNS